jgi:hypothetical protein
MIEQQAIVARRRRCDDHPFGYRENVGKWSRQGILLLY